MELYLEDTEQSIIPVNLEEGEMESNIRERWTLKLLCSTDYFSPNDFSLLLIYLQWSSNCPLTFAHLVSLPCLKVFNGNYKSNN